MKIFKEIKKVGIRDWFWFVVIMKRNEFGNKLSVWRYYTMYGMHDGMVLLRRDRARAHRIDMQLEAGDK